MLTPHNFLIHLRNHAPWQARLFDGVRSLGFSKEGLTAKFDPSSWPGTEVFEAKEELEEEVRRFFGPGTGLNLVEAQSGQEVLPFPVTASKYWNHIAFTTWDAAGAARVFLVRKTVYAEKVLKGEELRPGLDYRLETIDPGCGCSSDNALSTIAPLADLAAGTVREQLSYAHILTPFQGHYVADEMEARFYGVKEWGTVATPAPILQKFLGRIHYCDPDRVPLGIKICREGRYFHF